MLYTYIFSWSYWKVHISKFSYLREASKEERRGSAVCWGERKRRVLNQRGWRSEVNIKQSKHDKYCVLWIGYVLYLLKLTISSLMYSCISGTTVCVMKRSLRWACNCLSNSDDMARRKHGPLHSLTKLVKIWLKLAVSHWTWKMISERARADFSYYP